MPLDDSVCLDGVSGILQVDAGALPSRCVGQRDSDHAADVDGEFHETERLHAVSESLIASGFVAESDRLRVVSESLAQLGASGGHSAWRSRVGGLRLRRQARSRS